MRRYSPPSKDATRWDNFVKKAKQFVAKKLGIGLDAFENMTYGEFVEGAAAQITTLGPDSQITEDTILEGIVDELSLEATPDALLDADIAELQSQAIDNEKKWYKPSGWIQKVNPTSSG